MIYAEDDPKIIPIDWMKKVERWLLVPGTMVEGRRRRIKEIVYSKNNCYFAAGIPKSMIDFIYRSVRKLDLAERTLIFSRGTVRTPGGIQKNSVTIRELEWGVGTLFIIPRILKHGEKIGVLLDDKEYSLRLMELVVLNGLLRIAYPQKDFRFCSVMATRICAMGWPQLLMQV
jgi:hypothetical protein